MPNFRLGLTLFLFFLLVACHDDEASLGSGLPGDSDDDSDMATSRLSKVDGSGNLLDEGAAQWSCVLDNDSSLIWAIKPDAGGIHDLDNLFTWFNDDANTNQGMEGSPGGFNSCVGGIQCDTQRYIVATNAQGLCGATNWRLPTVAELQLLSQDETNPSTQTQFFPAISANGYWSSTLDNVTQRLTLNFSTLQSIPEDSSNLNPVILVHD